MGVALGCLGLLQFLMRGQKGIIDSSNDGHHEGILAIRTGMAGQGFTARRVGEAIKYLLLRQSNI